jgi:hypothetical protein
VHVSRDIQDVLHRISYGRFSRGDFLEGIF